MHMLVGGHMKLQITLFKSIIVLRMWEISGNILWNTTSPMEHCYGSGKCYALTLDPTCS